MQHDETERRPSRDDRIRSHAYLIWEKEGRPDGHAWSHWFKASQIVDDEDRASLPEGGGPGEAARQPRE